MRTDPSQDSKGQGWGLLQRRLAEALAALGEGEWQYLILEDRKTGRFVQFAVEAKSALLAEAVSNDYLPEADALSERSTRALVNLGWTPPPPHPEGTNPKPKNFHQSYDRPVDYRAVAMLAIRTLREVFQTPLPGRLEYHAFGERAGAITLPTLGLVRRPPPEPKAETLESIRARVLAALRDASGVQTLEADKDGDIRVPYGEAQVYVRLVDKPPYARIQAGVVRNVQQSEKLYQRLDELNRRVRFARFFVEEGLLFVATEVFTSPFVVQHVVHACRVLGELADDMRNDLQAEFGTPALPGEQPVPALKN